VRLLNIHKTVKQLLVRIASCRDCLCDMLRSAYVINIYGSAGGCKLVFMSLP